MAPGASAQTTDDVYRAGLVVRREVLGDEDGATVLVGGFGMAGMPTTLIDALIAQGRRSPSGWTSNCTDPAYVGAG